MVVVCGKRTKTTIYLREQRLEAPVDRSFGAPSPFWPCKPHIFHSRSPDDAICCKTTLKEKKELGDSRRRRRWRRRRQHVHPVKGVKSVLMRSVVPLHRLLPVPRPHRPATAETSASCFAPIFLCPRFPVQLLGSLNRLPARETQCSESKRLLLSP